jgi:hypothetical protein
MTQRQTDIAIIGAGPQALTLVTHILQKKDKLRSRIEVFDPSGTWMTRWHQQFAAQEIPQLRSPAVHHPDPNPHALRTFAEGRYDELHPPYDRPGTRPVSMSSVHHGHSPLAVAGSRHPGPDQLDCNPYRGNARPDFACPWIHWRHSAGAASRAGDRWRSAPHWPRLDASGRVPPYPC